MAIAVGADTPDGWAFTAQSSGVINVSTYLPSISPGDLVLAHFIIVADMTGFTPPAGWNTIEIAFAPYGVSSGFFWKEYVNENDTWSWGSSVSGCLLFSGYTGAAFERGSAIVHDGSGSDFVAEWSSVVCDNASDAVVLLGGGYGASATFGNGAVPTGYTKWYDAVLGSLKPMFIAYDLTPAGAPGTENPADGTTGGNINSHQMLVVLQEAVAPASAGSEDPSVHSVITPYYF